MSTKIAKQILKSAKENETIGLDMRKANHKICADIIRNVLAMMPEENRDRAYKELMHLAGYAQNGTYALTISEAQFAVAALLKGGE